VNLSRVRWDTTVSTLIAENDDERERIQFNDIQISQRPSDPITPLSKGEFNAILAEAKHCSELTTLLAFYREGQNDMMRLRYITAFFNFYFVIEGLYAAGKSEKPVVVGHFKRSKILCSAVESCLNDGLPTDPVKSVQTIQAILKRMNRQLNVNHILELLVIMRSKLHHYDMKTQIAGTPFTDYNYRLLAHFIQKICTIVLSEELQARAALKDHERL
jgi:hypothetical protein